MLNGRHRCSAIILAQVPISTLVVRGVAQQAMADMDGGRKRSVADVLGMDGRHNTTIVAGAARLVWNWAAGVSTKYVTTRAVAVDFARRHAEPLDRATSLFVNYRKIGQRRGMVITPSPLVAVLVLGNARGTLDKEVKEFLDGIYYGEGLYAGDARLTFRNWLAAFKNDAPQGAQMTEPVMGALIRAWNAFATGNSLTQLRFPPHPTRENMEVHGFYQIDWPTVPDIAAEVRAQRESIAELGEAYRFRRLNEEETPGVPHVGPA